MELFITSARYLRSFQVEVRFSNGAEGILDFATILQHERGPVFAPLKDVGFFKGFKLNRQSGTLEWPNRADFDPKYLYKFLKKQVQGAVEVVGMPRVAMKKFGNCVLYLYYRDDEQHHKKHFHVKSTNEGAVISIPDATLMEPKVFKRSSAIKKKLAEIMQWAKKNKNALSSAWKLAVVGKPFNIIQEPVGKIEDYEICIYPGDETERKIPHLHLRDIEGVEILVSLPEISVLGKANVAAEILEKLKTKIPELVANWSLALQDEKMHKITF